jgi:hypothetical protein
MRAWFGLLLGGVLALLAGIVTLRSGFGTVPKLLLAAGGFVLAIYYAVPPARRPIYFGWAYLTWPIGVAVSFVILAVVYYLVLTPIGLLRRLLGRDPMQRRFDREATTYWQPHPGRPAPERYFKTF